MRTLKSTTCLTPLVLALLPAAASAQLTISTDTTTPVSTATAVSGAPANIIVTEDGSITLASGSAITANSNNSVSNAGTLTLDGSANGTTAIDVQAGFTGNITNSGAITIDENFSAPNTDGNAIVDGPIAQASDRAAIRVRGAHSGDITQSGTVSVEGLNSAGVRLDGALTGTLRTWGTIAVRGDNSVGVKTQAVDGDVMIGSAVQVIGRGATALAVGGDVSGTVRIINSVGQNTGFVDDNDATMTLARGDLRVGAPAVSVAGNVGKGIVVAAAPTASTTNTDVDGDGIPDAKVATGVIQGYGNGAALRVGGATDTVIGAATGNTHGIVIDGSVRGNAFYSNTDATALQIGGVGGNVTVTGGLSVKGAVSATTVDQSATAILIAAGSTVPVLDNSGTISATISSPGEGAAYGVRDLSGTLTAINNTGFMSVVGTSQDITSVIDVSANTTGVTITQSAPTGTEDTAPLTAPVAGIAGNIITGSGNDMLIASAGLIRGNGLLGAGDDGIALSGTAAYVGNVDFGTGAATLSLADKAQFYGTANFNDQASTLTLSDTALYSGGISGGSQLAVTVNGGTLQASGTSDLNFQSLTVGDGGILKVALDTENQINPAFNVATATFAPGSQVAATINSLENAEGSYVIVNAGTITGAPEFASGETLLPVLFKGAVGVDQTAGTVTLDIARKSASELSLNRSQAAAYEAILAAAPADAQIQGSLLGAEDEAALQTSFDNLLPDHAGGNFDALTRGSRMMASHLTNSNAMFDISGMGGWFEAFRWTGNKDKTETASYQTRGWGLSGGVERVTGFGNVGLSASWMSSKNDNDDNDNQVGINSYEFGAFWRMSRGPFYAFARGTVALATFDGERTYVSTDATDTAFGRQATATWKGTMYSGMGGVSYEIPFGEKIALRPMVIVDYYKLHENGYTETGGQLSSTADAMDLTVAARNSTSSTAKTTLTGIYRFGGPRTRDGIPLTLELEGGWRNRLGGSLGDTVAHFAGGQDFRLTPDEIKSGWTAEARVLSGGLDYTWTVAGSAYQTQGSTGWAVRFALGAAF